MNFTERLALNNTDFDNLTHNISIGALYNFTNENRTKNSDSKEIFEVEDVTWAYIALPLLAASITAGSIIRSVYSN